MRKYQNSHKQIWYNILNQHCGWSEASDEQIASALEVLDKEGIRLDYEILVGSFRVHSQNKAYLFNNAFILYSRLDLHPPQPTHLAVAITARTKKEIKDVAKKLALPLEELVQTA